MQIDLKDIWPPKDLLSGIRLGAAALLVCNLAALYFVLRPPGGSPQELRALAAELRIEVHQRQGALTRTRDISGKVELGRGDAQRFMDVWFLDRRIMASTVDSDLIAMGREAGLHQKETTLATEPVEGTDDLSMLTASVNFEGTYANLMKLLNEIDRDKRLMIIESLAAAPQQGSNMLNINVRLNGFVRDDLTGPLPKFGPDADPGAAAKTALNLPPGVPAQ